MSLCLVQLSREAQGLKQVKTALIFQALKSVAFLEPLCCPASTILQLATPTQPPPEISCPHYSDGGMGLLQRGGSSHHASAAVLPSVDLSGVAL